MKQQTSIIYNQYDYINGSQKTKKAVSYRLSDKELRKDQIKQAKKNKRKVRLSYYEID